jgi:hypothetical protein
MNDIENHYKNCFFSAFQEYFRDRSDFDTFLDKLKADKMKIIRLGFFYHIITQEIRHAGITLIAIFSIMEATATQKYLTFDEWLLAKKGPGNIPFPIANRRDFRKLIADLQKQYYIKHGSSEKVRNFINRYFSGANKQKLIEGFRIKGRSTGYAFLNFNDKVKAIVDMLYNERSAFVHNARLPQISNQKVKMIGYCKVKHKDTYVSIQILINEIQKMFEKAFIEFLKTTYA